MRLTGSTWAVYPWAGSGPALAKPTHALLAFRN